MLALRAAREEKSMQSRAVAASAARMVISKTPYRISFFGGGTDYPAYYREHGGAVLGTTIDKYCYLTCRYLPPFFDHLSRIVYSDVECVRSNSDIRHPAIRAALQVMGVREGVEVHHDGDLPARSGLGSSSSCMVGILNALFALRGRRVSKLELGRLAIEIEQGVLAENVGSQDQTFAAHGGFNKILFHPEGQIDVIPLTLSTSRRLELQGHLLLCFTKTTRISSHVAKTIIENIPRKLHELAEMRRMVDEAERILYEGDLDDFGRLLHESWMLKRGISSSISNSLIDSTYERARRAGAIGGKVIGAGGGGFMLFYVPPERQARVRAEVKDMVWVPIGLGCDGSQIIHFVG